MKSMKIRLVMSYVILPGVLLWSVSSASAGIMLSEIMYNPADAPDGSDGDPFEYVELYNSSAEQLSLSGVAITNGITYYFTNNPPRVMNPGEYLLIVKDRSAFSSRYPGITNLADGVFSGKLSNDGETLNVVASNGVETLTYGVSGAWSGAANSFGPSLERISFGHDANTSVNWQATCAGTNWQFISWTTTVHQASSSLALFLDYDGMCLVDDVSLVESGSASNLITNGSFNAGMSGWFATNSHSQSRVEDGVGRGGGAALAIQCNESRVYVDAPVYSITYYGDAISNHVVSAPVSLGTGLTYEISMWVRRVGIGSTFTAVMAGQTNQLTVGFMGTPGRSNSVARDSLPVSVLSVTQMVNVITTGTANIVRARVYEPVPAASVEIHYMHVSTGSYHYTSHDYSILAMRDDGISPDLTAGDSVYAVALPPVTQNWTLVKYRVVVTGADGSSATHPHRDEPGRDHAYWVQQNSPQTNLPNWHLLVDGNPIIYPWSRHACAISPEGQIFTDIITKHRGNTDETNPGNTGIGIHFYRGKRYDGWYAKGLKGVNIRNRNNNIYYYYRRLVAEPLAYDMQCMIGLPTPRVRFICIWINGFPSITTELEKPDDQFLEGNGISSKDFVSRQSQSDGLETVGGDEAINNFDQVRDALDLVTSANRNEFIRTNFCYETIQHTLALVSMNGNGDQAIDWNMFQHRSATDKRWRLFPWDVDISFDITFSKSWTSLTNLHPYYQTPLHPNIWSTNTANPMGVTLFYPEANDATTLPYRYRQQATLWRYMHTLYTTNILFPKLDLIQSTLTPAFQQISAYKSASVTLNALSNQVNGIKQFITSRRNYLFNAAWSDKNESLWSVTNGYDPTTVTISEFMHSPVSGGQYVELYNHGDDAIDASHWLLVTGSKSNYLPFGTMIAPGKHLVIAASKSALVSAYTELNQPGQMIERYAKYGLWDWPIAFTSATEYASRVVEWTSLQLPTNAAAIALYDQFGHEVDRVSYEAAAPWPDGVGVAVERIDPVSTNSMADAWREAAFVGSPGSVNAATVDKDDDRMPDEWEQKIVAASGGALPDSEAVLAGSDFDGDGLSNREEFVLGSDPVVDDRELACLDMENPTDAAGWRFWSVVPTGSLYTGYSGRFYHLQHMDSLHVGIWSNAVGYVDLPATGTWLSGTNQNEVLKFYRMGVELRPVR